MNLQQTNVPLFSDGDIIPIPATGVTEPLKLEILIKDILSIIYLNLPITIVIPCIFIYASENEIETLKNAKNILAFHCLVKNIYFTFAKHF